ncbi:MAG: FAD-dependent oxidoreductase [Acidobacteriota bacterium]
MEKPVIMAVDDDPQVLGAVSRDLRRRYGENYRILRADSGANGLAALEDIQERELTVALFLVDQRMPAMSGVDFLSQALPLFPDARRALLTAYADTEAAIRAINEVAIDHYLLKPWDPPEEQLYPVLDDLLDEWQGGYQPPFSGVRVVGHRWSPEAHLLREFLARHQVPYRWINVEQEPEVLSDQERSGSLPLVILEDGTRLPSPTVSDLAERLGLRRQASASHYDLVIVGGGPAGLAAAVYGASEGLKTVMVERKAPGGQAALSSRIENYLGFPAGLSGADLTRRAVTQARRFGVEILSPQEVTALRVQDDYRLLELTDGAELSCHATLLAMGVQWRQLNVPGAERLTGAGVYYGAGLAEAIDYSGSTIYIIGGANSAGQAAMGFSRYAERVVMLVRGSNLEAKMSQYLVDQIALTANIEVALETVVTEVHGEGNLKALTLSTAGEERRVEAHSLFIFIGAVPRTDWLGEGVVRDGRGFLITGPGLNGDALESWPLERPPMLLETSVPGVFAVGDVRAGSVKRVASGVGEGGVAVQLIHRYLSEVGA